MASELQTSREHLSYRKGQRLHLVRRFEEQVPVYDELCTETVHILKKRLKERRIKVSEISSRVKSLESFLKKVQQKRYNDPFNDNKDFAGVRIVCSYISDVEKVEKIIYDEFQVVERVEKPEEKGVDRFGYLANHYIVKLNTAIKGPRYENLEHLVLELQVRTVLVNALAELHHDLIYKNEAGIPDSLIREFNGIFATGENLDKAIDVIYQKIASTS